MKNKSVFGIFTFEWFSVVKDIVLNCWLLVLAAIIGFVSVYVYEQVSYKPMYTSSATLMVQVKAGTYQAYTNLSASSEMAVIFSEVFVQPSMKEKAAGYLEKDEFEGSVSASALTNTNIINLSVSADEPEVAYAELKAILDVYPQISDSIFSNAVIDIVRAPEVPKAPSNSSKMAYEKHIVFAVVILTLGAIVLISLMRDTVKDEKSYEKKIGVTLLGTILQENDYKTFKDFVKRRKAKKLVTEPFASFGFVENYQKFATKLEYLKQTKGDKVFLITSVAANEGKTTVTINTALTLARRGSKVALLDMDLLKPSVMKTLDMKTEDVDLAHILSGDAAYSELNLVQYKNTNVFVGLNKRRHSGFTEWINRPSVKSAIDRIAAEYDYVLIDSMPISAAADVISISNMSDKSILVIKADHVKTGDINDAVLQLSRKDKLAGCLLNDAHKEFTLFGQLGADEASYVGRYSKYNRS